MGAGAARAAPGLFLPFWGASAPLSGWDEGDAVGAEVSCVDGFAVFFEGDVFDVAADVDQVAGFEVCLDPVEAGGAFPEGDGVPAGFFAGFTGFAVCPAFGGCDGDFEALAEGGDFADVALDHELCEGEHLVSPFLTGFDGKGALRVVGGLKKKDGGSALAETVFVLEGPEMRTEAIGRSGYARIPLRLGSAFCAALMIARALRRPAVSDPDRNRTGKGVTQFIWSCS